MNSTILSIDIGGGKTSVGLFNSNIKPLVIDTLPTQKEGGCTDLADRVYELACGMLRDRNLNLSDIHAVGVACPGLLNIKAGNVVNAPALEWRDIPVRKIFQNKFNLPVVLQSDTNAAALGEYLFGTAIGYTITVYITISTGIGCGIVINGEIYNGYTDAGGALGHLKVERDGIPCECGQSGCLEAYASGASIARLCKAALGCDLDAKAVFELARNGNDVAAGIIARAGRYIGYAISAIYQILDPGVIVLGGSVIREFAQLQPYIEEEVAKFTQANPLRRINIVPSGFNGEQVLLGIAYLAQVSALPSI